MKTFMNIYAFQSNAIMMYKADLNPIELLIWSRNRSLQEVQKKIYEIKSETSSSLKNDDNLFVATLTKGEI